MPDVQENKVLVVGAGLSGLAVACRLASQGYSVEVFEKNDYVGGKAHLLSLGEFTFDTGPSLFTMPDYVDEVFIQAGKNPRDYYQYKRLNTLCHYFYEDGLFLKASSEVQEFASEVEAKTKDTAEAVRAFLNHAAHLHRISEPVFIQRSLHEWKNYLTPEVWYGLKHFSSMDTGISMEKALTNYFNDPRISQLFCRYATYNGSNPYAAPGTLNVIPHLEYGLGAYMPEGGIHAIPMALYRLARELGVKFHLGQAVEEIVVDSNRIQGLRINGKTIHGSKVITNADVWPSYRNLMPQVKAPEKTLSAERSSSAFIFYWGINDSFPELDVHNIFFSADYRKEFGSLFDKKRLDEDPTVYVHVSSKVCEGHAPEGKENWFVMVNAPQHTGQDWEELAKHLRETIIAKLNRLLGKDIASRIVEEATLSPLDIEQKTSSYGGSLYGSSSNDRFAAFLRHPNRHPKIKGL
ncbi:MAG: phytoene desaturase, partial [Bacteroidota bacterium]|nr:phytoene desaturase [Bacteroidota bacterium]MDX5430842.1 phytoene desaturase [Bacteroidota bacterium]MDX5469586.1 phytoene desaturase [Bacteroidota bacterium]